MFKALQTTLKYIKPQAEVNRMVFEEDEWEEGEDEEWEEEEW
jgi:hypothetical protein